MDNQQITKDQHYVPIFYLNKFVNKDKKLEILDCELKKIVVARTPKNVCNEEYFYSLNNKKDQVSQELEKHFQTLESEISKIYDGIAKKILNLEEITFDDKMNIATFMSMQYLRGTYMRKQIKRNEENFIKQTMKMRFGSGDTTKIFDRLEKEIGKKISNKERNNVIEFVEKGEYSVATNNSSHLNLITKMENFSNLFFGKEWLVYISKSSKKFITADNPLLELFPDWTGKFSYGPDFLQRTHHFAMTPEILIVATYPKNPPYPGKIKRKTFFDSQKDNFKILDLNFQYPRYADRYAYASEKASLQDVIDWLDSAEKKDKEMMRKIVSLIPENK